MTVVVRDRSCRFRIVADGTIQLNDTGRFVRDSWEWLAERHPYVTLDEYIVMPNHLHGIILISDQCRGGSRTAQMPLPPKPLGRLIGAFKTVSTKRIRIEDKSLRTPIWQRNYYEHVIRNEKEMAAIREYIVNNPINWELDKYNPESRASDSQGD